MPDDSHFRLWPFTQITDMNEHFNRIFDLFVFSLFISLFPSFTYNALATFFFKIQYSLEKLSNDFPMIFHSSLFYNFDN